MPVVQNLDHQKFFSRISTLLPKYLEFSEQSDDNKNQTDFFLFSF